MNLVKVESIDEVYLALDQAQGALTRNGHSPNPDKLSCWDCYVLYLVVRGKDIYARQRPEKLPIDK